MVGNEERELSVEAPESTAEQRQEGGVIDQRQQQIDPAGRHRFDPNRRPDSNSKQPGNMPATDTGKAGDPPRKAEP